eukprot:4159469-Prymnesium_polylepis.1
MVAAGATLGAAGMPFGDECGDEHADDPMRSFAQSTFEFRDRFRVRLHFKANSSPFQRFNQPVLARVGVGPSSTA